MATGDPVTATATALELPRVGLADALRLVLLYHRATRPRPERCIADGQGTFRDGS